MRSTISHAFEFQGMGRLEFGPGRFDRVATLAREFGARALVVTGGASLQSSGRLDQLIEACRRAGVTANHVVVTGEPSPRQIDDAVSAFRDRSVDVVIGVGGGAVVDAGKAISAMLPIGEPVRHYLEGVGDRTHPGTKAPYIAVPTTAGTGAEATKNAVLSEVGEQGFKKSLRHDRFIPDRVVIDPELALSCPADVTAACGMDALTQLLEAYVSPNASPITDALAYSGLVSVIHHLPSVCGAGARDIEARSALAWGAFCSGVALAHAGLGIVHGFASPIGGWFPIPHGVVCGTLLAPATRLNIDHLLRARTEHPIAIQKYAQVGRLMSGAPNQPIEAACDTLCRTLELWTRQLNIPTLADFGVRDADIERIISASDLKQNAARLDEDEQRTILMKRITATD